MTFDRWKEAQRREGASLLSATRPFRELLSLMRNGLCEGSAEMHVHRSSPASRPAHALLHACPPLFVDDWQRLLCMYRPVESLHL